MLHYVLIVAMWSGSEWAVTQSEWKFRKQETCQLVGERLKRKHDHIKHYRCVERHEV